MKLPISWLKSFVATKLSAEEIADKLTMAGLEVEEILGGSGFSGVVVGHVLSVEDHPNADRLHIASVDVGGEKLQIVCGAPNLKKGQKVAAALIGAKLAEYEITKATLRGVDSFGMLCSERELGISDEHAGILVLPENAKPGDDVSLYLGAEKVLDVKVLANRPDCMSIIGLANEVAAITGIKNDIPPIKLVEKGEAEKFTIKVEDAKLCPRYMARFVKNVKPSTSPDWMKERLTACGVRPISLLVDISNYVMLEYGQPLHFFDLDKLADKTIVVRKAKAGEAITTLDGVLRKLTKDNLVIADTKSPIAVAGVMGGSNTEIDDHTKNILIEAAIFDKASIRRTSRALGLRSEAVARFEKGVAHMLPEVAINRAAELLADLAGGEVTKTKVDVHGDLSFGSKVGFSVAKMNKFLGTDIAEKQVVEVLSALGFAIEQDGNQVVATAPFWRTDILESVDVYEEIIRIVGYDKVPYTLPFAVNAVPIKNQMWTLLNAVKHKLSDIGFTEIMTYSFIGEKELTVVSVDAKIAPEVQNPLVKDQQYLRPTLVPKMLEAIRDNQFNEDSLYFYEIGKTFERIVDGKLPKETTTLAIGLFGGISWPISYKQAVSFYDLKGAVLNLLASLGIGEDEVVVKPSELNYAKKGVSADLYLAGKRIATMGEITEEVKDRFGIKKPVAIATMNLDLINSATLATKRFVEFSKYQHVIRDISAIFPTVVTVAEVRHKLMRVSNLVTAVHLIDIFEGKTFNSGERSLTFRLSLQSNSRTLSEKEVDEVTGVCTDKIIELGGKLRSGR
jgi:phenylalanyl-tRNA synthetase beta chain